MENYCKIQFTQTIWMDDQIFSNLI